MENSYTVANKFRMNEMLCWCVVLLADEICLRLCCGSGVRGYNSGARIESLSKCKLNTPFLLIMCLKTRGSGEHEPSSRIIDID